jgi:hypothetical protein
MLEEPRLRERYTTGQMVEDASPYGDASPRLVRGMVEDGLLDLPTRKGLGRGNGVEVTWPQNQFRLFVDLVALRSQGLTKTADLANVPVYVWLWTGEEAVPLRQVRRALDTWTGFSKTSPASRSRESAKKAVALIASPDAKPDDVRAVVKMLTEWSTGADVDRTRLRRRLYRVFDPNRTGRNLGSGLAEVSPDTLMSIVERRARLLRSVGTIGALDDELLRRARTEYVMTYAGYAVAQPLLAADPETGSAYETPDPGRMMMTACMDFVHVLDIVREREEHGASDQVPESS